ncbi:MAG TPA: ABC transporter permease [Vicinamibacterales bacterium]|nr:ABC transporter permease [Vicinamibacterales bacterium]
MADPDVFARAVVTALRLILPAATAEDVLGDLLEHYSRRSRGRRRWLVLQAIGLAWGLGRPRPRHQRRASPSFLIDVWLRDIKYAQRSLFRARGFFTVALLSLALGIGLTTAVFSVIDGVLLRPLPYGDPGRIVRVREVRPSPALAVDAVPRMLLNRWEKTSRALAAIAPYTISDARVGAGAESFVGVRVEVGDRFFDVLRTTPVHGRLLGVADDDPAAPLVAVLSRAFWQRAFAGDAAAIGRSIRIDDRPAEIVGVLTETFTFPAAEVAVYVPGRWRLPEASPGVGRAFVGPPIEVVARMSAGATTDDVEQEASELSTQLRNAPPGEQPRPATFEVLRLQDDLVRDVKPALVMVLAAVACVLAIVCVNLTNLLLARGTVRHREMAVRAALGASRWGMARPLVLEGALLAILGGAAGLGVAAGLLVSIPLTSSIDPLLAAQVHIDGRVLAFAFAVSAAIGLLVGVLPAWQAPVADVKTAVAGSHVHLLPGTAVRAERLRSALVVIQVALAMVLAVGASLLSRSLVTLLTVDLGFQPGHALALQVRLPPAGGSTYDWRARFYQDFLARLSAHPGVRAAGFTSSLPMSETFSQATLRIDGIAPADPASPFRAHREVVTPGYFAALGLAVTSGRGLLERDTESSERVVLVNDAFATTYLAGREAIGQRVMLFGDWCRVVGVVRSKRHSGLRSKTRPEVYVPLAQSPPDVVSQSGAGVVVRTAGSPADMLPFVRSTLRGLQPDAALEQAAALDDRIWESTAQPRFYATVMGTFAALSLITGLVGLFGVLSYVVERRRVEIGVRRALGATASDIAGLVIGKGLKLVAVAVPIGLVSAAAGSALMRNLLFGIQPSDPLTFVGVVITIAIVSLAASAWPARRAAAIEPMQALREE